MNVDERARHELHQRLDDVLGDDVAGTLMSYLPPVGWADVATKHDLAALEQRMDLRFEALDHRFEAVENRIVGTLRGELTMQTRTLFFALASLMVTLAALTLATIRLS